MGSRLEKNSQAIRKSIEQHSFEDETGEEYEGSKFGGFPDYFRRKKIKLQNLDAELRSSSVGSPQIFKGIVAYVNGYTQPSLNDLHRLIVSYGGGFMQYLDGKTTVTHIIAANLTPKKAVEFKRYRIVKPAWIVDSANAGRVLSWENYKVIEEGPGQRLLGFNGGKIVSQVPTQSRGYRDQTNGSWYASQLKEVADGIEDEDGFQFTGPQAAATNGSNTQPLKNSPDNLMSGPRIEAEIDEELILSNPESFSVSSSLEDVLNAADSKSLQNLDQKMPLMAEVKPVKSSDNAEDTIQQESQFASSPNSRKDPFPLDNMLPSKKARIMTAEEHNTILLADPHIRKSSTANPDFIRQYYSESRLHHLSTWKADLKSRLLQMAAEKSPSQKQAQKQTPGSRRYIMHVDFDSFFCAVSLKSAPEYVDKPAVVAHGSGLGSEIASCNYAARVFGVKNGMWMKKALELCPDIKVLPYDFPAYEETSRSFYTAILDIGGVVQSVSVDEALVDISSLCILAGGTQTYDANEKSIRQEQEKANEIARNLRQHIKVITECTVSIGLGGNILLAKVALRKAKPAGQYQITPEKILDFIGELLVQDLPGVAYSIGGKLGEMGVKFVKDVRSLSKERLMTVLGPKTGEKIWDYSRGIDRTEVGEQVIRKSVSAEVNWCIRFTNQQEADEFVQNLCSEVQRRLLDQGVKAKQMTMKIMKKAADASLDPPKHLGHGKCDTFNKSVILGVATNSAEVLGREAVSILRSYGFSPGELRGLGIQMAKLQPLKPVGHGRPEDSQKRISFTTKSAPRLVRNETEDPIDDPDSPRKSKPTKGHPVTAIARANAADVNAKKLLNLTGTQFLLPTQTDPTVLAELPQDIRSKLMAQGNRPPVSRAHSPAMKSRSQSPQKHPESLELPVQLDAEVFDALPEDVKAEIRASYYSGASSRAQSLLPQSPHKIKLRLLPTKITTPTKRRSGLFSGRNSKQDANSTLAQSNFLTGSCSNLTSKLKDISSEVEPEPETLDPEFLAALPESIRQEIISEHRRNRLAQNSGLAIPSLPSANKLHQDLDPAQRTLKLTPKPPKPTFTIKGLRTPQELRDTISSWYKEFCEDGPHEMDVGALERYLRRVVIDERDLSKCVGVVAWIEWLIGESEVEGKDSWQRGVQEWKKALDEIRAKVQDAVRERGLGLLSFN